MLRFYEASEAERDYSVIGSLEMDNITDACIYCNHCQPCPAGIDIAAVNMYTPFLWRAPPLELLWQVREFFPDHAGKGSLLSS